MNNEAIGVFDSGLGGLTAVREMLEILPNENIVYFGDTGRVPYGSKSTETISKYAMQDARFLKRQGVKMIVAACGTVSSVAPDLTDELGVPYTGESVRLVVKRYMAVMKENDVDTIILGCTHYPLLAEAIGREMGDGVTLIDSGKETALYTKKILEENRLLRSETASPTSHFFVSDTPADFEKYAGIFLKRNIQNRVQQINIEEF